MTHRNPNGQYKRKPKGILALLLIMAIIGVILYYAGDNDKAIVIGTPVVEQEATEDPRVQAWLASQDAKLQAQLHIFEEDRTNAIQTNKDNIATIEATYKASLKAEAERNAKEMFKVNANLDGVRKEILNKPSLK